MDAESTKGPESLTETGEAVPLPRSPSGSRRTVEAEARKRRRASLMVITSSVVAIAVIGIAYALFAPG